MRKVDSNSAIVIGRVTRAKAWDPRNGATFCNGTGSIRVGECDIPFSVALDVTQKSDERVWFNDLFTVGAKLCLSKSLFSSYTPKPKSEADKPAEVFRLDVDLPGVYRVENEVETTNAVVSGVIKFATGEKSIVEASYLSRSYGDKNKKPEPKTRRLRLQAPPGKSLESLVGSHITAVGQVAATDGGGVLFKADTLVKSL
jgi:hypothetical protein